MGATYFPTELTTAQTQRPLDVLAAERFLRWLDPTAGAYTFQTFDDEKEDKRAELTRVLHGSMDSHAKNLTWLNEQGAGIFVTINRTDLHGRSKENMTGVRKYFVDTDGAPLEPIVSASRVGGLLPSCIVESSPNNYHVYWNADCELDQFPQIQNALAEKFGTDKAVKDLPRVMRLPGFYHQKRINGVHANECGPFMVRVVYPKEGL